MGKGVECRRCPQKQVSNNSSPSIIGDIRANRTAAQSNIEFPTPPGKSGTPPKPNSPVTPAIFMAMNCLSCLPKLPLQRSSPMARQYKLCVELIYHSEPAAAAQNLTVKSWQPTPLVLFSNTPPGIFNSSTDATRRGSGNFHFPISIFYFPNGLISARRRDSPPSTARGFPARRGKHHSLTPAPCRPWC